MDFLKFLAGIGFFAGWSLILWFAGYWSRKSSLWKAFSVLILILSVLVLLKVYFIRLDLGRINFTMQKGSINKINNIELVADLKLDKYSKNKDLLIIIDENGRNYQGRVLYNGGIAYVNLHSADSFIIDFKYLIGRIKNFYIVLTWGKLGAFLMSVLAVFLVWLSGKEGKIAYLIIDD